MKTSTAYASENTISTRLYNFIIGAVLLYGFLMNVFIVKTVPVASLLAINIWVFLIGYLASCLFGIYLFTKSDNPVVSFIGFNFVAVPFGLIVNIVTSQYSPELVINAMQVTTVVTCIMMVMGTAYPKFFESIASGLFWGLIAAIVAELVLMLVFKMHLTIMDWIVAAIFCGYIGYDWGKASRLPKTVDNAVDSAAALYMDIINLFLRILSIMGKKD
jgi:FtsH-binding integral membrane protein